MSRYHIVHCGCVLRVRCISAKYSCSSPCHRVSRAINTYNATVRNCPTSDNGESYMSYHLLSNILDLIHPPHLGFFAVLVDFGLSLAFRIGPGIEEAANFVYNLGADLFDELVAAEVEGTVRRLAYTATHDQIDDVQEELSAGVCSTLHSKLATYGVQVMNVTITKVILPIDIRDRLEKIAALKTDMSIREKIHDLRIRAIEDEAAQSTEATRESNERKLKEIEAERIRYDVERRVLEEEARGRARVEEMKAMADADLALQRTRGNEMVGKVVARRQAEALMKKNYIQCQTMRIEAEKKVKIEVKHSETEVVVAESKAVRFISCDFMRDWFHLTFSYPHRHHSCRLKGRDDHQGRSRVRKCGLRTGQATIRA